MPGRNESEDFGQLSGPLGELGDISQQLAPEEGLKKTNFKQWYEESKIEEWKDNYLDYNGLKDKIEKMFKNLYQIFSEKDETGGDLHLPKNDPRVTDQLQDFENLIDST